MLLIGLGQYCLEIVEYVMCLPAKLLHPFVGGRIFHMCEDTEESLVYEVIKMFLKSISKTLHLRGGCGLPSRKWHVCKYATQQQHEDKLRKESKRRGRKVKGIFFPITWSTSLTAVICIATTLIHLLKQSPWSRRTPGRRAYTHIGSSALASPGT